MTDPTSEPAPFARGERVIFRPRPAGPETVELVEHRSEGWGGWYVRTARPAGAITVAHRWAAAVEFNRLDLGDIPIAATGGGGCRRVLARIGKGALALGWLILLCAALWELPS